MAPQPQNSEAHFRALVESARMPSSSPIPTGTSSSPTRRPRLCSLPARGVVRPDGGNPGAGALSPTPCDLRQGYTEEPRPGRWAPAWSCTPGARTAAEFPVLISLSPIRSADGLSIFSAIRDITQQREAEQNIRDLNAVWPDRMRNYRRSTRSWKRSAIRYRTTCAPVARGGRLQPHPAGRIPGQAGTERTRTPAAGTSRGPAHGVADRHLLKLARVTRTELQIQEWTSPPVVEVADARGNRRRSGP